MNQNFVHFNHEFFEIFEDFMLTKYNLIEISQYPKLINFLKADSIILDEENLNQIEPEFIEKINECFFNLKQVFIKLNFSAAIDAEFLINELKCFNFNEIIELMKGSKRIEENLEIYFKNKNDYNLNEDNKDNSKPTLYLIIKPWMNIPTRNEFRLFIDEGFTLKGISQRHLNDHFEYLEWEINNIHDAISKMIKEILNDLNDNNNSNFILDNKLFIDVVFNTNNEEIKIIDVISEWNRQFLINNYYEEEEKNYYSKDYFLLFDGWQIINSTYTSNDNFPDFKYIKSENEIINKKENQNKFPLEIQNMGGGDCPDIEKIMEYIKFNS